MTGRPFVASWRALLMGARLDPTAVAVGFVLAEYADFQTGRNVRPSHATISDAVGGLSSESIRKATHRLRAAGLIQQTAKGSPGRAAEWRLTDPAWADDDVEHPTPTWAVGGTPQPTPHVSVDPPRDQEGEEGDARATLLLDAVVSLMADVDPNEADRVSTSPVAARAARAAADAGTTLERLSAAWHEQPVNEVRHGPGLARRVLERAGSGDQLIQRVGPTTTRHRSTRPRTRQEFPPTSEHLSGWGEAVPA